MFTLSYSIVTFYTFCKIYKPGQNTTGFIVSLFWWALLIANVLGSFFIWQENEEIRRLVEKENGNG